MPRCSKEEVEKLEKLSAGQRIAWAADRYGEGVIATSSFGRESAVLLHLISINAPALPIIFLDTGFLFKETMEFKEELKERLNLNIREVRPQIERDCFVEKYGPIYRDDPDFCCGCNKSEPMKRALEGVGCWISGLRRDQSPLRANLGVIEESEGGGPSHSPRSVSRLNLYPLIDWPRERLEEYLERHGLPRHPLAGQGYTSIGCEPCTSRPSEGGDARSGRWAGHEKTECGIHLINGKFQPSGRTGSDTTDRQA